MKRKIIIIGILLGLVGSLIGYGVWTITSQASSHAGSVKLSERAEEFISKEKVKGGREWDTAQIDESADSDSASDSYRADSECFSISILFKSTKQRIEHDGERCVLSARVLSPPARLVISRYSQPGGLGSDSSISMRKLSPDKYLLQKVESQKYSDLLAFTDAEGLAVYVFDKESIMTIAFSGMQQPDRLDFQKVGLMVDSIIMK